ncbi:MAG: hypothetical protein ABIH28_03980 [archaeon]
MRGVESKYFEKISKLITPKQIRGQYDDSYMQMCALYCVLRNTAKDVLRGDLLEDVGRKKIRGLLRKIKKSSKETIFERDKEVAFV